jgi:ubiquinone/menaquinone biosynthesis C-methylase UbiE
MKTLEESIAIAMDSQDTAIIPFLPYVLQDWWALGTTPETVINFIQKYCKNYSNLNVLDLGCGKGAASVKIAEALKCNCYGIDGIPEFIETAKEKAKEYGVETLCRFEVGDIRQKIEGLNKFDVIILYSIGPVFGDYYTTLTTLSKHLTDEGIIIIDDAYLDDSSTFQHPTVSMLHRKELLKQIGQAGMELIDETAGKHSDFIDSTKEMESIVIRCNELKIKYPEKAHIFEDYVQIQTTEYDALDNEMICSVMVLKKCER